MINGIANARNFRKYIQLPGHGGIANGRYGNFIHKSDVHLSQNDVQLYKLQSVKVNSFELKSVSGNIVNQGFSTPGPCQVRLPS